MHFYESMIMYTADGLQVKSYANQHPEGFVIAKPKYIPTTKIRSEKLQIRQLDGKEVNRLDYWIDDKELERYINEFKKTYPDYIYDCDLYNTWFFGVPKDKITFLGNPKKGTKELLAKDKNEMDKYQTITKELVEFLSGSGVSTEKIGLTNSTLLGNYTYGRSDIDLIVFGKDNFWKTINYLKEAKHPMLKWRDYAAWQKYYASYNTGLNFTEEEFIRHAQRKVADGFFDGTVFSIFGVEEENEATFEWGKEKYERIGMATIKGTVTDNYNASVRPACYEIENASIVDGPEIKGEIRQVVSFARDFLMQAYPKENLAARGILEKVIPANGDEEYYRIAIGYFDSYISRKGEEFIKVKL
ncbi:MAG: hypothetical protein ABIA76_05810 [Candidatus Diapherotrites archaeon]